MVKRCHLRKNFSKWELSAGSKFVIKQERGTRKQFLILNGEAVLAFVKNGEKFADCDAYTEVTTNIQCKEVDGLKTVDLEKAPSSGESGQWEE